MLRIAILTSFVILVSYPPLLVLWAVLELRQWEIRVASCLWNWLMFNYSRSVEAYENLHEQFLN